MPHKDPIWPDGLLKPRYDEWQNPLPAVSPRDTVKIGNDEFEICWRALSREQVGWLEWEARAYIQKQMVATKVDPKDIESVQGLDALNNENELRQLCASMLDPDAWEEKRIQPAFKLQTLRSKIIPDQQSRLNKRWWIWQTNKSEGELDDEQVEMLIEEAKKKSPDPAFLTSFGVGGLLICISTLAEELRTLQTVKSLDTTSGDGDLSDSFPDNEPELSSLRSLFTKLSPFLVEELQPLRREIEELRAQVKAQEVG